MPTAPLWKTRPIFITSTFRDMHAERDYLRNHVFPVLEERLRERRHRLEPIDLRWGIDTVSIDDEHAKELLVLKVCLNEINRSRPFLIALLGDRYGWIPPSERIQSASQEAGFQTDPQGKSVTALEIEYGILDEADQRKRSHFYFRDPLPYDQMSPEQAALYCDKHNPAPGSAEAYERLQELKRRLENDEKLKERIHHYKVNWDAQNQQVCGLEAWGNQVIEDLWRDMDEETANWINTTAPTWQEQERNTLEEFIESHARHFVGRQELCQDILSWAMSEATEHPILSIYGRPGSGKSALFSQIFRLLSGKNCFILANAAGISQLSGEIDSLLRRWCQELGDFLLDTITIPSDVKTEELISLFHRLLNQASKKNRIIILLDALNQLENTTPAQYLTWLPAIIPQNVRILTTTLPGTALNVLKDRDDAWLLETPLLHEHDASLMINHICNQYHRTISPFVTAILLSKNQQDGHPAAGSPLWLQMAVEELNLLDADDFQRAERDFSGSGGEKLQQMLADVAKNIPQEIPELYAWILERNEQLYGAAFVSMVLSLIALGRQGWRESDLEAAWKMQTEKKWPAAQFAGLRRQLRGHLIQRGGLGQWYFFHQQMLQAVETRYLSDDKIRQNLHALLVKHLQSLPDKDPLRRSELMVHLIGCDDKANAARYYASIEDEDELNAATRTLSDHIQSTPAPQHKNLSWILDMMTQGELFISDVFAICHRIISHLDPLLAIKGDLQTRLKLLEKTTGLYENFTLSTISTYDTRWQAFCLGKMSLGDVYRDLGQVQDALHAYNEALGIFDIVIKDNSGKSDLLYNKGICHERIGSLLQDGGDSHNALDQFRKRHEIIVGLLKQEPENTRFILDISTSFEKIGTIEYLRDNPEVAINSFDSAVTEVKKLLAIDTANNSWLYAFGVYQERRGLALMKLGLIEEASAAFGERKKVIENLVRREPDNAFLQRDLSACHSRSAEVSLAKHNPTEAFKFYRKALSIRQKLHALDPDHILWARDLAISYRDIADTLAQLHHGNYALQYYVLAKNQLDRLVAQDPDNMKISLDFCKLLHALGVLHLQLKNITEAKACLDQAIKLVQNTINNNPEISHWQNELTALYLDYGEALLAAKEHSALQEHCIRWSNFIDTHPADAMTNPSRYISISAQILMMAEYLFAAKYYDHAYNYLNKAIERILLLAGMADLSRMNRLNSQDLVYNAIKISLDNDGDFGKINQMAELAIANLHQFIDWSAKDEARLKQYETLSQMIAKAGTLSAVIGSEKDIELGINLLRKALAIWQKLNNYTGSSANSLWQIITIHYNLAYILEKGGHPELKQEYQLCATLLEELEKKYGLTPEQQEGYRFIKNKLM